MEREDEMAEAMTGEIDRAGDEGGATRAFTELRAEVTILRKAVEALPAAIEAMEPVDYGPSFGGLAKSLGTVEAVLSGISGHPVLKLTPEQHTRALERAGSGMLEHAARTLRDEADSVRRERERLAEIVGAARTREVQKRVQAWTLAAGLIAGLVLFPLLAAFLPGGSYLAALASGTRDRWQAGISLLHIADPAASRALGTASRLVNANTEALQACADAARKAGRDVKCTVNVEAPGQ